MPTTYRGNACTYKRATLLETYGSHTFDYDGNGLRTKKNDTVYTYMGGKLIREEGSNHTIDYIYGNDGITGIKYNGVVYIFRKNVFGDVTHIYDTNGVLHAHYIYDAWGNHTVVNDSIAEIGTINPIRYRSYYYDSETNLYYLRARYYDPETGRFISQDNISYLDPEHLTGLNLYAYCNDNPVMHTDSSGCFALTSFLIGMGIAALIGATVGAVSYTAGQVIEAAVTGDFEWSWGQFVGNAVGGAVGGAIAYLPFVGPMLGATISGMTTNACSMMFENIIDGTNYSFLDIAVTSILSGAISAVSWKYMDFIKIPGINSGTGSLKAISQQIYTKFQNDTIKRITWKTFVKMSTYDIFSSLFGIFGEELSTRSKLRDFIIDLLP